MRETTFIDRNKDKWIELEKLEKSDPDEIANDFIRLTSDLSYAQTHFPHSKITSYLNFLAGEMYKSIYANKKQRPLYDFWVKDLPLVIGKNKKVLWVAVILFLSFTALGALCTVVEPAFIESVLGLDYIDMTMSNIEQGKPFGVYANTQSLEMFLRIFANNFMVGLLLVVSGIFLGIGTIYHTFNNGLMVGCFFSLFFSKGLGLQAIGVINLHGTIELMGLIIECMAGLLLGLSVIMPGSLSRKQAFKKGLTESAMIFLGTVPFTFIAAFIESYVTRYGQSGMINQNIFITVLLFLVLIFSWLLIIWYFFFYSAKVAQEASQIDYLKRVGHEN